MIKENFFNIRNAVAISKIRLDQILYKNVLKIDSTITQSVISGW